MVMNGGVERLVNDIGKCFGHLDSILCPVSRDEVDSMTNIGRGKLGWMTSNRLLEGRILLETKSGYSGSADTSARCNEVKEMTRIKLKKNSILLSSKKRLHNDSGKE